MERIKKFFDTDAPVTEKELITVTDDNLGAPVVDSSEDNSQDDEKKFGLKAVISPVRSDDFLANQLSKKKLSKMSMLVLLSRMILLTPKLEPLCHPLMTLPSHKTLLEFGLLV